MPDRAKPTPKRRSAMAFLALAALAAALVLVTQQSLAAALGAWLGGLWVSVVEAVLRLLGAFLGA